jgi:7-cyano-7-deazaguanine synthase
LTLAIVLLSGGIDSTTALYWALKKGYSVQAVTFVYRGRPERELEAAQLIALHAGVNYLETELPFMKTAADIVKENTTALAGVKVPEGYIPTRNLIFYSLASYYAEIYGANYIIGGHLETDSIGFPDASPKFFSSIEQLINDFKYDRGSDTSKRIRLLMPFLEKSKTDVLKMAIEMKVPLELTWSCYYAGDKPCRKCVTCLERADAFAGAGLKDPLMHDSGNNTN